MVLRVKETNEDLRAELSDLGASEDILLAARSAKVDEVTRLLHSAIH
jgi:hypothetical protein